jgi:hypothetical protein
MEPYINKNNVNDTTYQSELIPPSCFRKKAGGINSQTLRYNLHCCRFRKLSAH